MPDTLVVRGSSVSRVFLSISLSIYLQAGASFDALFDSVPAGELEQAMKVVMRQRESRDSRIVKVE